jgi:phosphoglycolate phosphatase
MKKVIAFDFDGTIADSKKLYIETIRNSLIKHSFIYPKGHIAKALGPKLEETLRNLDRFSPEMLQKLKKDINDDVTKEAKKLRACPGAKETLKKLQEHGSKIVLLTNSAGRFAIAFLRKNNMLKYFDNLFYAENFGKKEDALKAIAKRYNTKTRDITYVADKKADVKIAKNAGCRIIVPLACSWDKKMFHGEKYTIKSLKDLEF